jgi:hypothetical protein
MICGQEMEKISITEADRNDTADAFTWLLLMHRYTDVLPLSK